MAKAWVWDGTEGEVLPGVPPRDLDEDELDALAAERGWTRAELDAYLGACPRFSKARGYEERTADDAVPAAASGG